MVGYFVFETVCTALVHVKDSRNSSDDGTFIIRYGQNCRFSFTVNVWNNLICKESVTKSVWIWTNLFILHQREDRAVRCNIFSPLSSSSFFPFSSTQILSPSLCPEKDTAVGVKSADCTITGQSMSAPPPCSPRGSWIKMWLNLT